MSRSHKKTQQNIISLSLEVGGKGSVPVIVSSLLKGQAFPKPRAADLINEPGPWGGARNASPCCRHLSAYFQNIFNNHGGGSVFTDKTGNDARSGKKKM